MPFVAVFFLNLDKGYANSGIHYAKKSFTTMVTVAILYKSKPLASPETLDYGKNGCFRETINLVQ
jgi:hypothetical protein